MLNPYFLMALLFSVLAALTALDSSLTTLNLLPWFDGLRWLRVHFITLGILTEITFGIMAAVVAARSGQLKPKIRWDVWLLLNTGIVSLVAGIPLMNAALIITGGTLIFVAAVLLIKQIAGSGVGASVNDASSGAGRKFYLAGLSYLLLGIFVGTGLWQGWNAALQMRVPIEVHIHANNWGFMALVFAGLIVDLYPGFAGRALAFPRSITAIFWLMTIGALALVLGPWFKSEFFTVAGIVLHLGGTFWLFVNVVKPLAGVRAAWTSPGLWTLLSSYLWILAPVLVAPLILLQVPGFPGAGIEQNAPQALIYGWVLLFGFAIVPYIFRRVLFPAQPASLGGTWLGLFAVHAGAILLWLGIFAGDYQGLLHGLAYALWAVALASFVFDLWRMVNSAANPSGISALASQNRP